ncbi:hypothetical protein BGZ73_005583 [Actinomortierella ambigua]|nr:hypothetical protein BGZ73_005583 [Actinomortierella ambigua]
MPTSSLLQLSKVIKRGDPDYEAHSYQYATSSHPEGLTQPEYIIYPKNDDEVIEVIQYAKEKKVAVAIRTGGHQYSGASSTYKNNIQLDLSTTYRDIQWLNSDRTLVTFGVSFSLGQFHHELAANHRFVPHGQCKHVHLGGHVQSGGYGQLGRSFGLLADHVQKIRIITADCKKRVLQRGIAEDRDLFFAVLGGSPGNFGVVTHVTIAVHRDEDHPNAHGMRLVYPYDRDRLKRLLDLLVQMADDDDFPADFDLCISVISAGSTILPPKFVPFIDWKMKIQFPEIFGVDGNFLWPPAILVYAQWANLGGKSQPYDKTFFDKIKAAGGERTNIIQEILLAGGNALQGLFMGARVNDDQPYAISKLMKDWIFSNVREFQKPYIKRVYLSNSRTLAADNWAADVCNRIHEIQDDAFNGCDIAVQIQHFGGKNSRMVQNDDGTTAFSWRDSNICCVLDVFYNDNPVAKETARKWQERNDQSVGRAGAKFCTEDRGVLWGAYNLNLDEHHNRYYDKATYGADGSLLPETKYERLCKIKKAVDPDGVFTPNGFCVGAPPVKVSDL